MNLSTGIIEYYMEHVELLACRQIIVAVIQYERGISLLYATKFCTYRCKDKMISKHSREQKGKE